MIPLKKAITLFKKVLKGSVKQEIHISVDSSSRVWLNARGKFGAFSVEYHAPGSTPCCFVMASDLFYAAFSEPDVPAITLRDTYAVIGTQEVSVQSAGWSSSGGDLSMDCGFPLASDDLRDSVWLEKASVDPDIIQLLAIVSNVVSKDDTRTGLSHACIGKESVVGTDGHRLMEVYIEDSPVTELIGIRRESMDLIRKLPRPGTADLFPAGKQLNPPVEKNILQLFGGNWAFICSWEDDIEYPEYRTVVPATFSTTATLPISELKAALDKAKSLKKGTPLILDILPEDSRCSWSVKNSDGYHASGVFSLEDSAGSETKFQINSEYMYDAVRLLSGGRYPKTGNIRLELGDSLSAVKITHTESQREAYQIVMPMRMD